MYDAYIYGGFLFVPLPLVRYPKWDNPQRNYTWAQIGPGPKWALDPTGPWAQVGPGRKWPWDQGPEVSKNLPVACSSILTDYEPISCHGDPIRPENYDFSEMCTSQMCPSQMSHLR